MNDTTAVSAIKIGNRPVGIGYPTYLIAEIGSNHNGSLKTARELVRLTANAGVDAVKFQAYRPLTLYAPHIPYDGNVETARNRELLQKRLDILPRFILPDSSWKELKIYCNELGVDFLCTPFDLDYVGLLDGLGVHAHKIASGDITWFELLEAVSATGKPVILSTGASTLVEVERALMVLRESGCQQVILLHCVSNYPPQWEDFNLRVIETMRREFQVPVGLSDHSPGSILPIAAVTLGACVIEKHVTLSRKQEGLDHHFALEIDELASLVKDIRHTEAALGVGNKTWAADEDIERYWVRRGLWLRHQVKKGEVITRDRLRVVRPSHGIDASRLHDILGRRVNRDLEAGEPLMEDTLA